MKDNFSKDADLYAQYRPHYPLELFQFIFQFCPQKLKAWDCGTGNGQAATILSSAFKQVYATDISAAQMEQAVAIPNIHYSLQPAEHTQFPEEYFDLITVAQAIHWFDFEAFYQEVLRVSKKSAVLAVIGYDRIKIDATIDAIIDEFYFNQIGPYWDKERKWIDEQYKTIPFPFKEIDAPPFMIQYQWTLQHFIGYINTWSAVKHYIKANDSNPTNQLKSLLTPLWSDKEEKDVRFEILLRIGTIH